ncbi:MAG: tRNA uridine-5-carboxymethylaminomethyl(34) synthesis enzyme MnmG [Nitrospirota bacterium]
MTEESDIIVVGGGHAGCEAALASVRLGCRTLLFTLSLDNIAQMSCNPAIGGIAKGHIVREIDALGGEMARIIDRTGIQFRMLNTRKGPAVQAIRAQADKDAYQKAMLDILRTQENLLIIEDIVDRILVKGERVKGIITKGGEIFKSGSVILTTGTFLQGLIHIGMTKFSGGRIGEPAVDGLSDSLHALGFQLGRLKTGTPPRLDKMSIDFTKMIPQYGDTPPPAFSFSTKDISVKQEPCFLTYTNQQTHRIIIDNISHSPLYSGIIKGIGPRYCPSIEDKIMRFPDKDRHQIFLEPEGVNRREYYPNGISTSLPIEVQREMIHSIKGLDHAVIVRPGYAIEYDFVFPTQLKPTLETKLIKGLYHAGQINGTSGYEEAAAQGLMAGINAALTIKDKEELILRRSEGYIGVLIDDLVTKGTKEPYRMFTSRAEYRLLLRNDNADLRLMEKGKKTGLISKERYERLLRKMEIIEREIKRLNNTRITPPHDNRDTTLAQLLRRPEINFSALCNIYDDIRYLPQDIAKEIEVHIKYEGYIKRQLKQLEREKSLEDKIIPSFLDYDKIIGLSKEVREKLNEIRPVTLGQASRISGITPAAISILTITLESMRRKK